MEGVCIFLQKKYDWKTGQGLLTDLRKFLEDMILGYDKEGITQKLVDKFNKFLS